MHTELLAITDQYLRLVAEDAPGLVSGLAITGSLALGDYRPPVSDIDFVAVLSRDPVMYIDDRWLYDLEDELPPVRELDLAEQQPVRLLDGDDLTIAAAGYSTRLAVDVRAALANEGVRAEVIDLMARILVAVFEAQGGKADESGFVPSQDQAGALGSQSHRLLTAVERVAGAAEQGEPAPSV